MENKVYSIEDMLNAMKPSNKETKGFSAAQIWEMIGNRASLEEMGFTSEDEMKQFIVDNPYSNI